MAIVFAPDRGVPSALPKEACGVVDESGAVFHILLMADGFEEYVQPLHEALATCSQTQRLVRVTTHGHAPSCEIGGLYTPRWHDARSSWTLMRIAQQSGQDGQAPGFHHRLSALLQTATETLLIVLQTPSLVEPPLRATVHLVPRQMTHQLDGITYAELEGLSVEELREVRHALLLSIDPSHAVGILRAQA